MAALGLRCCARAFSSCGERGLLFVAVRGLLIAMASLCYGAQALGAQASVVVARGLSSCGSQALGSWASVVVAHGLSCSAACGTLPGPGLEPMFPPLAGRFLTTVPQGKSLSYFFKI